MTHRDVARRIDDFYREVLVEPPLPPFSEDVEYYHDRCETRSPCEARKDVVTRILMEAFGERDADGIVRPDIERRLM